MRVVFFMLATFTCFFNAGCIATTEVRVSGNELSPFEYEKAIEVKGSVEFVSKLIIERFSEYIKPFYQSELGMKLNQKFVNVDSDFDLSKMVIFQEDENNQEKYNQGKRSEIKIVLSYIQERVTPSYQYNGNFAKSIGGFELVLFQIDNNLLKITVKPRGFQVKGGLNCTMSHGFQCGMRASRVLSAPFEENLILKYVQYLASVT